MNVIKNQRAIDIFENEDGEISIVQENLFEDPSVVCFSVEHAKKIANAILQIRAEIEKGE